MGDCRVNIRHADPLQPCPELLGRQAVHTLDRAAFELPVFIGTTTEHQVGVAAGLVALLQGRRPLGKKHSANLACPARHAPYHVDRLIESARVPGFERMLKLRADLLIVRRDDDELPLGIGSRRRLALKDQRKEQYEEEERHHNDFLPSQPCRFDCHQRSPATRPVSSANRAAASDTACFHEPEPGSG